MEHSWKRDVRCYSATAGEVPPGTCHGLLVPAYAQETGAALGDCDAAPPSEYSYTLDARCPLVWDVTAWSGKEGR
jgi:hypothetical protein